MLSTISPHLFCEKKNAEQFVITIVNPGEIPLKAIITFQSTLDNNYEYKIEAILEFYRGASKVDNILKLEEDNNDISELINYYEKSIQDKQLLQKCMRLQKESSTNPITKATMTLKERATRYKYIIKFFHSVWFGSEMLNVNTIDGVVLEGVLKEKVIARTAIRLDGDVITAINSTFFNSILRRHLLRFHMSNVTLAIQLFKERHTTDIKNDIDKFVRDLKNVTSYAGLGGSAIVLITYSIPALLNGTGFFSLKSLLPIITAIMPSLFAIAIRRLAPQIVSALIRFEIRRIMK